MKGNKTLSFEEFIEQVGRVSKRYGNFPAYWCSGCISEIYRESTHFLKFKNESPELNKRLENLGKIEKPNPTKFKEYEKSLYEAYKIMKKYGASENELLFLRKHNQNI